MWHMRWLTVFGALIGATVTEETPRSIDNTRRLFRDAHVCGETHGDHGHVNSTLELSNGESCIIRVKPEHEDNTHVHVRLLEKTFDVSCHEAVMHIVINNELYGPFCKDDSSGRHRRGSWGGSEWGSKSIFNKP